MFFMKKRYRNIFDANVNLHKYAKREQKEKKTLKKILRRIIFNLKVKIHSFQENANRNLRTSIRVIFVDAIEKRYVKITNSSMFSNEKIMSIIQWIIKIKNKLYVNADQFDTKQFRTMYVLIRSKELTAKHLNFRTRKKIWFSFLLFENMLITLKEMFDDLNRKLTIINEFRVLRIKNKDFHIFWLESQRISFDLN